MSQSHVAKVSVESTVKFLDLLLGGVDHVKSETRQAFELCHIFLNGSASLGQLHELFLSLLFLILSEELP